MVVLRAIRSFVEWVSALFTINALVTGQALVFGFLGATGAHYWGLPLWIQILGASGAAITFAGLVARWHDRGAEAVHGELNVAHASLDMGYDPNNPAASGLVEVTPRMVLKNNSTRTIEFELAALSSRIPPNDWVDDLKSSSISRIPKGEERWLRTIRSEWVPQTTPQTAEIAVTILYGPVGERRTSRLEVVLGITGLRRLNSLEIGYEHFFLKDELTRRRRPIFPLQEQPPARKPR